MAHSSKLTQRTLGALAPQIALHWPHESGTDGVAHARSTRSRASLRESFEVWMIAEPDLAKPWWNLSEVARATGRWHHQLRLHGDTAAGHYARSASRIAENGAATPVVTAVMASPMAASIEAAISWIDRHEEAINKDSFEDPVVRLLVIPSRGMHALWLVDGNRDQLFVVDASHAPARKQDPRLVGGDDFRRLLTQARPVQAMPPGRTRTMHALGQRNRDRRRPDGDGHDARLIRNVRVFLLIFILVSSFWMLIAAAGLGSFQAFFHVAGVFGLLSTVWFIGGMLLGFLFGIPRSLASTSAAIAQTSVATLRNAPGSASGTGWNVRPNTNLEQISDWLTKVLVGVGLTQIGKAADFVQDLTAKLSSALAPLANKNTTSSDLGVMAVAISGAFLFAGFAWGYFESRTTLMRVFNDEDGSVDVSSVQPLPEPVPVPPPAALPVSAAADQHEPATPTALGPS